MYIYDTIMGSCYQSSGQVKIPNIHQIHQKNIKMFTNLTIPDGPLARVSSWNYQKMEREPSVVVDGEGSWISLWKCFR
jgi:hypothetical protein